MNTIGHKIKETGEQWLPWWMYVVAVEKRSPTATQRRLAVRDAFGEGSPRPPSGEELGGVSTVP